MKEKHAFHRKELSQIFRWFLFTINRQMRELWNRAHTRAETHNWVTNLWLCHQQQGGIKSKEWNSTSATAFLGCIISWMSAFIFRGYIMNRFSASVWFGWIYEKVIGYNGAEMNGIGLETTSSSEATNNQGNFFILSHCLQLSRFSLGTNLHQQCPSVAA